MVGRQHVGVKRFEVAPHSGSGIGEATVHESIGLEKIAELVVNSGRRDRQQRQDRESQCKRHNRNDDD